MKKLWFLLLLFSCLCGVVLAESADQFYRLGPGDKLNIGVWGFEDLQAKVTVLPDGTIFFPLIGQLKVEGLTIPEAQQRMAAELAVYVKNPQVSIVVEETRMIEVKVLGEVTRPGIYQLKPGSTVTDGIAMAGGPTQRAELSRVGVFAPNQSQPRLDISLGKRNKLEYSPGSTVPELLDGDTVYVPETSAPNWTKIFQYITGLDALRDIFRK